MALVESVVGVDDAPSSPASTLPPAKEFARELLAQTRQTLTHYNDNVANLLLLIEARSKGNTSEAQDDLAAIRRDVYALDASLTEQGEDLETQLVAVVGKSPFNRLNQRAEQLRKEREINIGNPDTPKILELREDVEALKEIDDHQNDLEYLDSLVKDLEQSVKQFTARGPEIKALEEKVEVFAISYDEDANPSAGAMALGH